MRALFSGALALAITTASLLSLTLSSPTRAEEPKEVKLLNVSYDPTRELYEEINRQFIADYKSKTGVDVKVEQSHGGAGKQVRAVLDGLKADVVTLALAWDIVSLEQGGLVSAGWQNKLPDNASPYTSTIVFLVKKGNPKGVKDWSDLVKGDTQVIVPNPKTSGGARWIFLAGWAHAAGVKGRDFSNPNAAKEAAAAAAATKDFPILANEKGKAFVTELYKHVPVLDTGARGSTVSFAQKGIGDVLLTWENEAWLALEEFGKDKYEIVYPPTSILAEPPVAVVDKVVDARGTRKVAEAYLKHLYTKEAQNTIALLHYRPRDTETLNKYKAELPPLSLFTIDEVFGGWEKAYKAYFADGGVFDQIYKPAK